MKCCLVILYVVISLSRGDVADNEFEKDLTALLEMWLKGDTNIPISLPPADVIPLPKVEGSYYEGGVQVTYSSSELQLLGVPEAHVRELEASECDDILSAQGTIVAPSLTLYAKKYNLDGSAYYFYTINETGEIWANFDNFVLTFDVELESVEKSMWVKTLQFGVRVDDVSVEMTGCSSMVSSAINNKAASIFAKNREDMERAMAEAVTPAMNSYLASMTPEQLLEVISSARRQRNTKRLFIK